MTRPKHGLPFRGDAAGLATIVLTFGGIVIGAASAIAGVVLTNRHATAERKAIADERRRQDAGRVLGRIQTVLLDLEPMRVAMNINNASVPLLERVNETWLGLRDELAMFAAGDDSDEIAAQSRSLTIEVSNLLNRLSLIVWEQNRGNPGADREILEAAQEHYAKARELTDDLLRLARSR